MPSPLHRRDVLRLGLLTTAGLTASGLPSWAADEGELLYNGIRLPALGRRNSRHIPTEPVTPAYLTAPPAVIPIDVGRQLFVDDFLVAQTTLTRTHHRPTYHAKNPVLTGGMVFSDGVWYDPQDKTIQDVVSRQGRHRLRHVEGRPRLGEAATRREEGNESRADQPARLQHGLARPGRERPQEALQDVPLRQPAGEEIVVSVGPLFGGRHPLDGAGADRRVRRPHARCFTIRSARCGSTACGTAGASRAAAATGRPKTTWSTGAQWGANYAPPLWCGSDKPRSAARQITKSHRSFITSIASLTRASCWACSRSGAASFRSGQKPNEVCVGYSRDGWSWTRPDRRGFLPDLRDQGRVELRQRPVGGRLLPGGGRPAVLLLQRPGGRQRHVAGRPAPRRLRLDGRRRRGRDADHAAGHVPRQTPVRQRGRAGRRTAGRGARRTRARSSRRTARPIACRFAATRRCSACDGRRPRTWAGWRARR